MSSTPENSISPPRLPSGMPALERIRGRLEFLSSRFGDQPYWDENL